MAAHRGLDAALIVADHLPSETDRTASINEVATRRTTLLGYLNEALRERAGDRAERERLLGVMAEIEAERERWRKALSTIREWTDDADFVHILADDALEGRPFRMPGALDAGSEAPDA